jgi:hypothetical protein
MADRPGEGGRRLVSYVGAAAAAVLGALAVVVLAAQIQVTAEVTESDGGMSDVGMSASGITRVCGSAFDGVVDRTGWEAWWAADLAEPDDQVRDALVRTTHCPDAVNTRIAIGAFLAAASMAVALAVLVRSRHDRRRGAVAQRGPLRLRRLGRVTAVAGSVLTVAGMLAVVWLVADADSTLFLYTDRLVVAVVGLIVLVPALALVVAGWALTIAADAFDESGDGRLPEAARLGDDRGTADAG